MHKLSKPPRYLKESRSPHTGAHGADQGAGQQARISRGPFGLGAPFR